MIPGSCKGNMPLLRTSYSEFVALGHKAKASDFIFVLRGLENIKSLVQGVQIPEMGREIMELFTTFGVDFKQQGGFKMSGEMPISFVETVNGDVYRRIRESTVKKCYLEGFLMLACEELPAGVAPLKFSFKDSWINLDAVDLSVEDTNSAVKPSGTFIYNGLTPEY